MQTIPFYLNCQPENQIKCLLFFSFFFLSIFSLYKYDAPNNVKVIFYFVLKMISLFKSIMYQYIFSLSFVQEVSETPGSEYLLPTVFFKINFRFSEGSNPFLFSTRIWTWTACLNLGLQSPCCQVHCGVEVEGSILNNVKKHFTIYHLLFN